MTLGAKSDNQNALVEPLKLEIRTNKEGLGVAEERKRKKEDEESQQLVYSAELVSKFKARMRDKFNERKLTADILPNLQVCLQAITFQADVVHNQTT
jgi:hypothetical protein